MCIAAQAQDAAPEPAAGIARCPQKSDTCKMAVSMKELVADKAISIKLFTKNPELKELLSAGDIS